MYNDLKQQQFGSSPQTKEGTRHIDTFYELFFLETWKLQLVCIVITLKNSLWNISFYVCTEQTTTEM